MTLTGTLASSLQLLASVTFPREHRSPDAAGSAVRVHTATQPTSIEQVLAGRGGNDLTMRWLADDTSLRTVWAGPTLTS